MRDIPEEMAARIESGAATLCHAWRVTRADGVALGFTDHDQVLAVDGTPCSPIEGFEAGAREGEAGFEPGSLTLAGHLGEGDDALTEAAIGAGLFDRARVELWRVDWMRPDLKVRLWVGRIRGLKREGGRLTVELEGPLAALDRQIGRTYGRLCEARLGDGRCGVDLEAHPGARCDKRWETCVGTFGNGVNFRGFPDTPGDDFIAAHPVDGGRHDGRSRR